MTPTIAGALFWLGAVLCVVAQVAILRATFRARPADGGDAPAPRADRASELAWAVLPAVALALLFLLTWRTLDQPPRQEWRAMPPAVTAQVTP